MRLSCSPSPWKRKSLRICSILCSRRSITTSLTTQYVCRSLAKTTTQASTRPRLSTTSGSQRSVHSQSSSDSLLHGKNCIITGASRGIGLEIAKRFSAEGANCTLIGRNEETLKSAVETLATTKGVQEVGTEKASRHRVLVGDVGSEGFWKSIDRRTECDILVNAAGLTHYSPLFVTRVPLVEEVIQTNLLGTIMACRTIGKRMMANANGCIINVASLLGLKGGRGSTAYAASKAGVIGLTRALAAEVGEKGVRVNVIVPGYIDTDMTEAMTPQARSVALNAIPMKRFGKSSEIADAAAFLATNQYANNCVLNLDGGLSAI